MADGAALCRWCVYALQSGRRSYVGATNNLKRRLRQHNREIAGGAKATARRNDCDVNWTPIFWIQGFENKVQALQFEWALKHTVTENAAKSKNAVIATAQHLESVVEGQGPTKKRKYSRSRRAVGRGPTGRVKNLGKLLKADRWTSKAPLSRHVPLSIYWLDSSLRPDSFAVPSWISEFHVEEAEFQLE